MDEATEEHHSLTQPLPSSDPGFHQELTENGGANQRPDIEEEAGPIPDTRHRHGCRYVAWSIFKVALSVSAHIGFICCMVIIIWSRHRQLKQEIPPIDDHPNNFHYYYLVSSSMAGFLYIVMLVEAATCDTYQYIRNFSGCQSAEEYVERVRDARPLVRWHAECYHYEVSTQARLQTDTKGRVSVRHHNKKRKVVAHCEAEAFQFEKWRDLSRDMNGYVTSDVARIECSKVFIFKDDLSKERYMEQYIKFRERNRRRDEFMEHEEEFVIPGYTDRLTACVSTRRRPCWLSEMVFWSATICLLTWPYRWLFRKLSTKTYVIFIKELEV